ncbi:MAG TPA: chemotaxis protein CheB [Desulfobacterales bacterium]
MDSPTTMQNSRNASSDPQPPNENKPPRHPSHYVGIGASAGGLEAIEAFFKQMKPGSGLAFIVIQHLSPDYKSLMVELLSKRTEIPVKRAQEGAEVEADTIYLIPPKTNLKIFHGKLLLVEQDHNRGINLPIDIFLRSLAEDQGEKAIAVILSGTGSDGMRGIRAIKESGGMVMVQSEDSAKFDGMPKSAISTGLADFILTPEEMPQQLLSFAEPPYVARRNRAENLVSSEDDLTRIFSLLRERNKVDFTHYKPSTVIRRIQRRMTVNQVHDLSDYVRYMEAHPAEISSLYRELLIGVTSFFRDRQVFESLQRNWLPQLIANTGGNEIRMWVAGCSTGEEAYTLAILFRECMEMLDQSLDLKIFATDVDRDAILQAGSGIYPESIAADLSPRMLAKYFFRKNEHFQVVRNIRETVVFAQHNLLKDPPFTNINLISCRNLLIYLQPILQRKALELFNFSLAPQGLLLLGTSETVGDMSEYFKALDHKGKIYRSRGKRRPLQEPISSASLSGSRNGSPANTGVSRRPFQREFEEERLLERLSRVLTDTYLPLTVIVNESFEILHSLGDTRGFFSLPPGKMHNDITKMVTRELSIPVATGIQKVFKTNQEVRYSNIRLQVDGESKNLHLNIRPLPGKKGQDPLAVIFIEPVPANGDSCAAADEPMFDVSRETEQRIADLEQELQFTRENLQATIEELETSNEELQATNEELLASNEELQSTNEELQSVNEELYTVNAEYQRKIIELTEVNNDLENMYASTRIGTLFLDENLEIRKFTPRISKVFRIVETDIGRPIGDISHRLKNIDVMDHIRNVHTENRSREIEVVSEDDRWYLMRLLPYSVAPETFSGIVLSFIDISQTKSIQKALERNRSDYRQARRSANFGSWKWDLSDDTMEWSDTALQILGVEKTAFAGRLDDFLAVVHPAERDRVEESIHSCVDRGKACRIEFRIPRPGGETRWVSLDGNPERDADAGAMRLFAVIQDVSDRIRAQETARHLESVICDSNDAILVQGFDGAIRGWNPGAGALYGWEESQALQMNIREMIPREDRRQWMDILDQVRQGESFKRMQCRRMDRDCNEFTVRITATRLVDNQGNPTAVATTEQRIFD